MKPITKENRLKATLPTFLLLMVGFLVGINLSPAVHAFSNPTTSFAAYALCEHQSTCVAPALKTHTGDLLTAVVTCSPEHVNTTAVTINLSDASGDLWTDGPGIRLTFNNNLTFPITTTETEVFYALRALQNTTGDITLTLDATVSNGCTIHENDIGISVSQFMPDNSEVGQLPNNVATNRPPFSTPFLLEPCFGIVTCASSEYFFNVLIGNYIANTATLPPSVSNDYPLTQIAPSTYFNATASFVEESHALIDNPNDNTTMSGTISCQDRAFVGCNQLGSQPDIGDAGWDLAVINLAFALGPQSSGCFNVFTTAGGVKNTAQTFPLIANRTYVNWFRYTGASNVWMTKMQIDIAAVINAPTGGTNLTLALYELPTGTFDQAYAVAQGQSAPLPFLGATLMPNIEQTFTLHTNPNPQNDTLFFQFAVNPNAVAFLVLTTTHNGVTVYTSKAVGNITADDTFDPFVTDPTNTAQFGILPFQINAINFNVANLNLFVQYVIPCGESIFQTPPTKFNPNLNTTVVAPINCTTGTTSLTVLNSLIEFWPIWIVPMLMGGLFGIIGLFIGLILGMTVGTVDGIVPISADIMLFMGVALIMVRREI